MTFRNGPFYYFIQVATLLILAANTSFALSQLCYFVMDFVLGSYRY